MGTKKATTKKKTPINKILSGDPVKDFLFFLESKEMPFDFGVDLIERYSENRILISFFKNHKRNPIIERMLSDNINVISKKWLNK